MRLEDQHGKPYFYNPDDASVQWELPQVTKWGRESAGERRGSVIYHSVFLPRSLSLPLEASANPARTVRPQPRPAHLRRR